MQLKEYADGKLVNWLALAGSIKDIASCEFLRTPEGFNFLPILDLIIEARYYGAHWLWDENDIYQFDDDDDIDDYYHLPSVDMTRYLGLENNYEVKKYFQENNAKTFAKKIIWDAESSAWYPKFKTKDDAIRCLVVVDKFFDKKYLKIIKEDRENYRKAYYG